MVLLIHDFEDNEELEFARWLWFCQSQVCMEHFIRSDDQFLLRLELTTRNFARLNLIDLGDVASWSKPVANTLLTTLQFAREPQRFLRNVFDADEQRRSTIRIVVPHTQFAFSLHDAHRIQSREDHDILADVLTIDEFTRHLQRDNAKYLRTHFNEDALHLMQRLSSLQPESDGWFYTDNVVSLLPLVIGTVWIFCNQPGEYLIDRTHELIRPRVDAWYRQHF